MANRTMSDVTEKRPIIMICGCQKYRPYLDAAIKRMERPEWRVVGILGDATLTAPRVDGAVVTLPVPDTYEGLPAKVQAGFAWCHKQFPKIPGVFKTDDDIIFPDKAVIYNLIVKNARLLYWGVRVGQCGEGSIDVARIHDRFTDTTLRPRHQAARYAFGAGYWVGGAVLPIIAATAQIYAASSLEDVCTGYVLNSVGVMPERHYIDIMEHPRVPEYLNVQ